ncbi:MAG: leucine-rich repeat domain-containing protein [Alphaproteobacteria bacterium]|nr:leucine-rich repeat domain-containing protein [Alphaproteobacteria bacterium]
MKKWILILMIIFLPLLAQAAHDGWSDCDDGGTANCEYQIKDGVLTVRPYDSTQEASIPDYERDCTKTRYIACTTTAPWRWDENRNSVRAVNIESGITSVGKDAFEDMTFTKVNLPDGLVSIGQYAFLECDRLSDINFPEGLLSIDYSALWYVHLESIVIPSSVSNISDSAFSRNSELKSFVVGANTALNESVFLKETNTLTLDLNNFKMYCAEGNTSCTAALQKAIGVAKNQYLVSQSMEVSDLLTTYTKDGNGFYQIGDKLYANADLMTHGAACDNAANCQAILEAAAQGKPFEVGGKYYATLDLFAHGAACTDKKNCDEILASGGQPFKVGSRIYNSIEDFAKGNHVKYRIYTVEEANRVAGEKNTVTIRYR